MIDKKKIIIASIILGLVLLAYDYYYTRTSFDGNISRLSPGKGPKSENVIAYFDGEKAELDVEVSDQILSEKKRDEAFVQAMKEIDETYLGENDSPDNVCYDLNLKPSYVDGLIMAYWKFDKFGFIQSDGKLVFEEIPEDGEIINLTCEMSYEGEVRLYSFSVVLCHKSLETLDGKLDAINQQIKEADKASRQKESLSLPKDVKGLNLTYGKKMNFRGLQVMLLGIVTALALEYGKRNDEKKARLLLIEEKEKDYPAIVSELSILMSAGLSFRKAIEKMVIRYSAKRSAGIVRPGYEDMVITYRKISEGEGELRAIEELGKNSDSKEYRKLSMLLLQNIKKGSKDLLDTLEKEEKYAFELRKQKAIKAGEEASTKLLIPMGGMLFIVIIILVVPALMQMNI